MGEHPRRVPKPTAPPPPEAPPKPVAARDRLAALLPNAIWPERDPWPAEAYDEIADRLIAAGVGDIDVERLARALQATVHGTGWTDRWGYLMTWDQLTDEVRRSAVREAAAIAAAYREDAG